MRGFDFATKRESKGDAQILFRIRSTDGTTVTAAGQIDTIFRHKYREPVSGTEVVPSHFAVQRYRESDDVDVPQDPYRRYPRLDVRLCYNKFEDQPYVVTNDEIVSHLATCPVLRGEKTFMMVINLDRVRVRIGAPQLHDTDSPQD